MAMAEWLQSTFHRYVAQGVYPVDWGASISYVGYFVGWC